eukprot:g3590.t1
MSVIQRLIASTSVGRVKSAFHAFAKSNDGILDIEQVRETVGTNSELVDILEMTDIDGSGKTTLDAILFYLDTVITECPEATAELVIRDLERLFLDAIKIVGDKNTRRRTNKKKKKRRSRRNGTEEISVKSLTTKIVTNDIAAVAAAGAGGRDQMGKGASALTPLPPSAERKAKSSVKDTVVATPQADDEKCARLQKENDSLKEKLVSKEKEIKSYKERIDALTSLLRRTKIRSRIASLKRDVKHRKITLDEWLHHAKQYASHMAHVNAAYYRPLLALAKRQDTTRHVDLMGDVKRAGLSWFGRKAAKKAAIAKKSTSSPLTEDIVRRIFGNISEIAVCAQIFAADMEKALRSTGWTPKGTSSARGDSPKLSSLPLQTPSTLCRIVRSVDSANESAAQAVERVVQSLLMNQEREEKALKRYMAGYMIQKVAAMKCARRSDLFNQTCRDIAAASASPSRGGLPLESLLVMPVQILPKRKMLLRELLHSLPVAHPSHGLLKNSLVHLESTIGHVDDHLNTKKLEQISSEHPAVAGKKSYAVSVGDRKYIMDGILNKRANFLQFRRQWFYLFSDCLMYCADGNKGHPFTHRILFAGAHVVDDHGRNEFKVRSSVKNGSEEWELRAESGMEKDHWMNSIQAQIDTCVARADALKAVRSYRTGLPP